VTACKDTNRLDGQRVGTLKQQVGRGDMIVCLGLRQISASIKGKRSDAD
jgi:hypothetical protein